MATFTIKRGDTAPALQISMSIAGTEPRQYWNGGIDTPEGGNDIRQILYVKFIMRDQNQKIVAATSTKNYTGDASFGQDLNAVEKTILAYSWNAGDTSVAGNYNAELEVTYKDINGDVGKKRTFPSTTGDSLIINVEADLNDTN